MFLFDWEEAYQKTTLFLKGWSVFCYFRRYYQPKHLYIWPWHPTFNSNTWPKLFTLRLVLINLVCLTMVNSSHSIGNILRRKKDNRKWIYLQNSIDMIIINSFATPSLHMWYYIYISRFCFRTTCKSCRDVSSLLIIVGGSCTND